MKLIDNLTEEQAIAVAAQVVTYRAVRGAKVVRPDRAVRYNCFAVEVETYSAEETVAPATPAAR